MKQMKLKVGDFVSLAVFIVGVVGVVLINKYVGVALI